jgi:hypothetical protein
MTDPSRDLAQHPAAQLRPVLQVVHLEGMEEEDTELKAAVAVLAVAEVQVQFGARRYVKSYPMEGYANCQRL